MIARTWNCRVPRRHADGFLQHLLGTGVAECAAIPGYAGAQVQRALVEDQVEFRLVTYWHSWDAVHAFAGPQIDRAVLFAGDDKYELEAAATVEHHVIVFRSETSPGPADGQRERE